MVTEEKARKWILQGRAEYVIMYDDKRPYHDSNKICMVGKATKTPRGATIEASHIEMAYVMKRKESIDRIEEYGRINRSAIQALVREVPAAEFDEGDDHDYGIPVLYVPGNQRTAGGIGK
jgi:hypothetical protein